MENVEELKKRLKCGKCQTSYTEKSKPFIHYKCQHHTCQSCLVCTRFGRHSCPVCGNASSIFEAPFPHDASIALKIHETSIASCSEVSSLQSRILTLEQERAVWETSREDHHKCAECEKSEPEESMQLCQTCHELKFEDLEDLKKNALCSACAIRKHMRRGHHTVDFFPYLSAYNFSSQLPKTESNTDEFLNAVYLFEHTFSVLKDLSTGVTENCNKLTDMARKSKSTKNQLECIKKMRMFSDESKSIYVGAESELRDRTKTLQESLAKVENWCNARMDDCFDDSETIKLERPRDLNNNIQSELHGRRVSAHRKVIFVNVLLIFLVIFLLFLLFHVFYVRKLTL